MPVTGATSDACLANCATQNASCQRVCPTTLSTPCISSCEAQAQTCFEQAIAIAREQEAKSWELRAVMSLARLLARLGRRDEARAMLAEIYGWFSEGFDTADLKDAKALLQELSD